MVNEAANNKYCDFTIDAFTNCIILVPGTDEIFVGDKDYKDDDDKFAVVIVTIP